MRSKDAIARIKKDTPSRFRADVVEKLIDQVEDFSAEQSQLIANEGRQEVWPPQFESQVVTATGDGLRPSEVSDVASPQGEVIEIQEEQTSLDKEISNTLALANELLGLSEETRSVTAGVSNMKKKPPKKSRESS